MPKSRVRNKGAVYTPPPRAVRSKSGPRWIVPAMLVFLLVGLAWIAVFYVTGGTIPGQRQLGDWNLVVGFVAIICGLTLATRWR